MDVRSLWLTEIVVDTSLGRDVSGRGVRGAELDEGIGAVNA